MAKLAGKTALITGGTTGIGFATAQQFLAEGAKVAITGQNQDRLEHAVHQLGSGTFGIRAAMQSLTDINAMIDQVNAKFDQLDIVVANAGITKPLSALEVDEAHINEQFDVNFKSVFFTVQKALPLMRSGGTAVLITSCLDQMGMPGMSIYSASKAAVRSLARSLSAELVERGIRVNAISPGPVQTPIYQKLGFTSEALEQMATQLKTKVPMQRFGNPDEIAKAVVFLASDDSSFVLGEELVVDGGWLAL